MWRFPGGFPPAGPHLYDLKISLGGDGGDVVYSYFGLRTFALTANPTVPASPVMNDTDLSAPDIEPCRSMPGTGCPGIAGLNASIDACKVSGSFGLAPPSGSDLFSVGRGAWGAAPCF